MPPGGPPKSPKWPSRLPKSAQGLPKFPKVTPLAPKVSPRSPKVSQRWSQVVPRGLPRPHKIDEKRSPRPSRDTFKKMNLSMLREPHYLLCSWSSLLREPHYLLCLSTSGNRVFLKSDENTAPAMLLEHPEKPVLAREREARLFFKKCSTMFSTALLCFAVFYSAPLCSTLVYATPLYPTLLYSRVDLEYLRNN